MLNLMKKVTNNMADTNIEVKLKNVRLSFDNLFEPQEQVNDAGVKSYSYNCVFLLDKVTDAAQIKLIQDAMVQTRDLTWPGQKKSIAADKRCLRDGEPADPDSGERAPLYDGYAGKMYLSAKRPVKAKDSPNPVSLIGPRKTAVNSEGKPCFPRLAEKDGLLYGGCFVNAVVRVYGYSGTSKGYPDRINCSLEAVQFKAHGERFGAKPIDAEKAFDEEEGEDDMPSSTAAGKAAGIDDDPLG
jgi:hypothetical protein